MIADFSKCLIEYPDGKLEDVRFIFRNGTVAVWSINKKEQTATRLLYATDATFTNRRTAREPFILKLSDDVEWKVWQKGGGCGCSSPIRHFPVDKLLDPDYSSAP